VTTVALMVKVAWQLFLYLTKWSWSGLPRPATLFNCLQDVDARDKRGHDR
jgi:hypothetical protein